jgi:hypothetical protein
MKWVCLRRAENLDLITLDPNSPQVINSNFESDMGALEEHEPCIGIISIDLAETIQDPLLNTNSLAGIVHSDEIVAADSTSLVSTRSQEHQVMNVSYVVLV